ncbi:diacylglycerol kinase family protein [uncultured Mucilaginibacter sp.]|uniref:diacylglycerol kinase family protein n=1 Tax=uncultured Mucilaginibacter sp. TaxID=797541 RepID=UPI0025FCEA38|nr:diacylglycerol kinase family protein [uncultured Mucilaginibacter sp.]
MNKVQKHLASYKFSVKGIWLAFRYESNMLFHLLAAIAVIAVNMLFAVTKTEWLITLMLIGLAWMAEIFNTAIEKLADRVTKQHDPLIGQVKDLAAGAVLIICLFAAICAVIIYVPYILK